MKKAIGFLLLCMSALLTLSLAGCSGGGSCSGCNNNESAPGAIAFTITSPTEYPAGVPVTAYLTITNTSNYTASGLTYNVPSPGSSGNLNSGEFCS